MSTDATRRAARALWEIEITRQPRAPGRGADDARADDDDLYWLRVPVDDRARLTWDLSRELYALAGRHRGVYDEETGAFVDVGRGDLERRLPRAAFVVTRG